MGRRAGEHGRREPGGQVAAERSQGSRGPSAGGRIGGEANRRACGLQYRGSHSVAFPTPGLLVTYSFSYRRTRCISCEGTNRPGFAWPQESEPEGLEQQQEPAEGARPVPKQLWDWLRVELSSPDVEINFCCTSSWQHNFGNGVPQLTDGIVCFVNLDYDMA